MTTCSAKKPTGACGRGGRRSHLVVGSGLALTLALPLVVAGCSSGGAKSRDASVHTPHDAHEEPQDAAMSDLASTDLAGAVDLRAGTDLSTPADMSGPRDMSAPSDLTTPPDLTTPTDLTPTGPITGGPCISGARGATAFRVRWTDGGGRATVNYEMHGLPDKSRWKVGVYGYGTGFTPTFADPFLGSGGGGLQLDSSDFIDVELSTVGVHSINSITLSIFGRSYSTGASGSFNWMTFTGGGSTPIDFVSNVTPYRWYSTDATPDLNPDDGGILLRIKAGGSSGSLVVNRLELCIDAP